MYVCATYCDLAEARIAHTYCYCYCYFFPGTYAKKKIMYFIGVFVH